MKVRRQTIILALISCILMAQSQVDYNCFNLPLDSFNYEKIQLPQDILNNITEMDNTPSNNYITNNGATLGRVLFYDVELSKNRTISCASCHIQKFSFTDTARFSKGFEGKFTERNSMGLIHARFQRDSSFFWDNRARTLEEQTLMPIANEVEMGLNLDSLVLRIAKKEIYRKLFINAFGSSEVSKDKISKALAQFIRSINTFSSKYRLGLNLINGNPEVSPFPNFTEEENLGKNLFMDIKRGNCQACHTRNIMVSQGAQNIGLDLVYKDNGLGALTNNPNSRQNGKFSVPSLINIELTAPYMHDGRYKTLEEVVNFYSDSIKPHPNLSGFLRQIKPGNPLPNNNPCDTCQPRIIKYNDKEKKALVAFLRTLTDTSIINDLRWSNPFCVTANGLSSELIPILSLQVLPNPIEINSNIKLQITCGKSFLGNIIIYNLKGEIIFSNYNQFYLGNQTLDIGNLELSRGFFIVRIVGQNNYDFKSKFLVN